MLPLQASVDLRVMIIKEYSAFPKSPALLEPHYQIVSCHIVISRTLVGVWGGSFSSAGIQLLYSTAPADLAMGCFEANLSQPDFNRDNLVKYKRSFCLLTVKCQNSSMMMLIYPTPPFGQDMTQGQFLSGV